MQNLKGNLGKFPFKIYISSQLLAQTVVVTFFDDCKNDDIQKKIDAPRHRKAEHKSRKGVQHRIYKRHPDYSENKDWKYRVQSTYKRVSECLYRVAENSVDRSYAIEKRNVFHSYHRKLYGAWVVTEYQGEPEWATYIEEYSHSASDESRKP